MEPATVDRIDHAAAVIASVVANSAGGKKGGGSFSPSEMRESYFDFHQSYEKKEAITDVEQWSGLKGQLTASLRKPK